MYGLQLLSVLLTLTCVVGDYTCLNDTAVIPATFDGCKDSQTLLLSRAHEGVVLGVVVCKSLLDTGTALALKGKEWTVEMCANEDVKLENETETLLCPLLFNNDKWRESVLAFQVIKEANGCKDACGKVACDRLLEVVDYVQERLTACKFIDVSGQVLGVWLLMLQILGVRC